MLEDGKKDWTYGLRCCCRRRRGRGLLLLLLKGPGRGCEELRLRIGCARRRMIRRGVGGWPWLMLLSLSFGVAASACFGSSCL
jgi:hypothetical protein